MNDAAAAAGKRMAGENFPDLAALGLLLAVLAWVLLAVPVPGALESWSRLYDAGDKWLFPRLGGTPDNYWFPNLPVGLALLKYHLPEWSRHAALRFSFLPLVLASFSAGALVHSRRAGLLAAFFSAFLLRSLAAGSHIQFEQFMEQVLVSASLLVFLCVYAAGPAAGRAYDLSAGLAFAAAVWAKGALAPLLPLLLLAEAWKRKDLRAVLLERWPMLAVPAAALLCWGLVNRAYSGGFVLLEGASRAGNNLVSGALGLVHTAEYDWRPLPAGSNYLLWAAAETASHPLRSLAAVWHRGQAVLFTEPLLPWLKYLFLAGAAGAALLAKRGKARPLILAAAYLAGLHLFMPVEGRYFVPAWFLLCCLAGMLAAGPEKGGGGTGRRAGTAALLAGGLPVLGLWFFCALLVVTFPLRARLPLDGAEGAIKSPWVQSALAARAMEAGKPDEALAGYLRALELDDTRWRRSDYALAALRHGGVSADRIELAAGGAGRYEAAMIAALKYLEEGKAAKAGELLSAALSACAGSENFVRGGSAPEFAFSAAARRRGLSRCAERARGFCGALPPGRRAALEPRLEAALAAAERRAGDGGRGGSRAR